MAITNPVLIGGIPSNQSVYEVVTTPRHTPGTIGFLPDGRKFEYVRMDQSTAIGKGKLATYDPVVAAIDKIAVQANTAAGSTTLPVTVTVTLVANELVGGFISIDDDAGEAEMYGIVGHAAHSSGTLTLLLDRPLAVAVTTSTTATIQFNACSVKISAAVTAQATAVEVAAGVPLVDVPAGNTTPNYFWVQKEGLANVLFGTVVGAVGQAVYQGEDAGSFQAMTMDHADTTDRDEKMALGVIVALLPVDTEYHTVRLFIA